MAQDAGQGCAEEEPNSLLGGDESPLGPAGRLRWVCGAGAGLPTAPRDGKPARPGSDPVGTDLDHPDAVGPPAPVGPTEQAPQRSRLIPRPRPAERGGDNLAEPSPAGPVSGTAGVSAPGAADGTVGAPGTTADPAEDVPEPEEQGRSGCQTDRPGWAGAHRHGAVRPSRRRVRRDRPPRRWC